MQLFNYQIISTFIKKYQVFLAVFLFLISKQLLKNHLAVNETGLLPLAKHFIDPDWIAKDWYLNGNAGGSFRVLFNLFAGSLSYFLPFSAVSIIGRILILGIFAYVVNEIAGMLKVSFWIIIPFLLLFINNQSICAGEWMISGLESKSLAYSCVLIALLSLLKRRYIWMILSLGLAISFHILVGSFAALSFLIAILICYPITKNDLNYIVKNSWLGILTASIGLWSIGKFLTKPGQNLSPDPDLIYVFMRAPHHLIPSTWNLTESIVIYLVIAITFILIFILSRDRNLKLISAVVISSISFATTGYTLYYFEQWSGLKFYWFRFPDTFIPFALYVIVIPVILTLGIRKLPVVPKKVVNGIFLALSLGLFFNVLITEFPKKISQQINEKPAFAYGMDDDLVSIGQLIKDSSDNNSIFLINPNLKEFYLLAERPVVVTIKHSGEQVNEWYERLCDIYGYELSLKTIMKREDLDKIYYEIPIDRLMMLKDKYDVDYYLVKKRRDDLLLPIVMKKGDYTLYSLTQF